MREGFRAVMSKGYFQAINKFSLLDKSQNFDDTPTDESDNGGYQLPFVIIVESGPLAGINSSVERIVEREVALETITLQFISSTQLGVYPLLQQMYFLCSA